MMRAERAVLIERTIVMSLELANSKERMREPARDSRLCKIVPVMALADGAQGDELYRSLDARVL